MKEDKNNNKKQAEDAAIYAVIAIMSLFMLAVTAIIVFNLK